MSNACLLSVNERLQRFRRHLAVSLQTLTGRRRDALYGKSVAFQARTIARCGSQLDTEDTPRHARLFTLKTGLKRGCTRADSMARAQLALTLDTESLPVAEAGGQLGEILRLVCTLACVEDGRCSVAHPLIASFDGRVGSKTRV